MENKVETMEKFLHDQKREILFARVASNLLRADKVKEAREICEHGLKLFPTYAPGHYILAKCYLVQKKFDEARVEFERVLRYDPNHLNALMELSHIYKGTGLTDIYKDYLLQLLNLDPLNDTIRAEAKSLGIYQDVKRPSEQPQPAREKTPDSTSPRKKHVDLSQFDNLDDDFETILQGRGRNSESDVEEEEMIFLGTEEEVSENDLPPKEKRTKFPGDLPLDREEDFSENNDFEDLNELEFGKETATVDDGLKDKKKDTGKTNADLEMWAERVRKSDTTEIVINPLESSEKVEEDMKKGYEKINIDPPDDESDDEHVSEFKAPKIVSQTLGEILVSQKKYNEALGVFRTLQKQQPDNESLKKKISFLTRIINLEKK